MASEVPHLPLFLVAVKAPDDLWTFSTLPAVVTALARGYFWDDAIEAPAHFDVYFPLDSPIMAGAGQLFRDELRTAAQIPPLALDRTSTDEDRAYVTEVRRIATARLASALAGGPLSPHLTYPQDRRVSV